MTVNKLQRFAQIKEFPNVLEPPQKIKGKWCSDYFRNANPIILELACGKAEYSLALARLNPDINYIGIDRKGARIWRGAKTALDESLSNVAFLRILIEDLLDYFDAGEVQEIWITFPDPFPRKGKAKKRLTSPRFLGLYKEILKPDSPVHLKTDDPDLFDFTLETIKDEHLTLIEQVKDIYHTAPDHMATQVQTYYESLHLSAGRQINYLRFTF